MKISSLIKDLETTVNDNKDNPNVNQRFLRNCFQAMIDFKAMIIFHKINNRTVEIDKIHNDSNGTKYIFDILENGEFYNSEAHYINYYK